MIVSGIFYDATGVLPSINIVFRATRTTLNGVLMGSTASVETQEDGSYAIELEPGYYDVNWQTPGGKSTRLGDIVADASGEMTLPQALEASPTPITQEAADDILALMREEAGRAEAEADRALAKANSAAQSAVSASQSATAASDSADSAAQAADALTNFGVSSIITLTQTEYDALDPVDPEALYIITGI